MSKKIEEYGLCFKNENTFDSKDFLGILMIVFGLFGRPIFVVLGLLLISFDHIKIEKISKWKLN